MYKYTSRLLLRDTGAKWLCRYEIIRIQKHFRAYYVTNLTTVTGSSLQGRRETVTLAKSGLRLQEDAWKA